MKLRDEFASLVLNNDTCAEAHAILAEVLPVLRDRLGFDDYCEIESAINLAVGQAALAGFALGLRAGQDPAAFLLEPDLSDANVERTAADLLNQIGD